MRLFLLVIVLAVCYVVAKEQAVNVEQEQKGHVRTITREVHAKPLNTLFTPAEAEDFQELKSLKGMQLESQPRYTDAYMAALFSDSECTDITAAYYLPLGICAQTRDPAGKKGLYKGSWTVDSSATSDSTNAITLTTYSKGQCRGTATSAVSTDSGPTACLPLDYTVNVGTAAYYKTFLSKDINGVDFYGGVYFLLYKDQDACNNFYKRPNYHFAEKAVAGLNECIPAAGFADGKDVSFSSCEFSSANYFIYDTSDGTCGGSPFLATFNVADMCEKQTSLSGNVYGFLALACINN